MHALFLRDASPFRVTLRVLVPYKDSVEEMPLTLFVDRVPEATVAYQHPNGDLVFESQGRFSEAGTPFAISLCFIRGKTDLVGAEVALSPASTIEAQKLLRQR